MSGEGVCEFAAMGLRAADAETIERVRQALFARGYGDPYVPGYEPVEAYGAYSSLVVVPDGQVVRAAAGIPASVVEAAQVAYWLGATRVQVWAETVDEVIPRMAEDPPQPVRSPSPWRQASMI